MYGAGAWDSEGAGTQLASTLMTDGVR
jgi:hypothetical protein